MKDERIFVPFDGKPGRPPAADAPRAAAVLEPLIAAACRAQGVTPEDFVAAVSYGSWLVHFDAGGRRQRLVWNGRDSRLVLQAALRSGGWEDLRDCAVATPDDRGFTDSIALLLGTGPGG